jgi:ABC-type maltose transport system permease subunit
MSNSVFISPSYRRQKQIRRALQVLLTLVALFFAFFPIVWIFSASLDPRNSLSTQNLIPPNASFANYINLLNDPLTPFMLWLWNSLKVATITSILAVFITALSAYAFSRFRFRGRRKLLLGVFLVQVFPTVLAFVAIFLIVQAIGFNIPWLGLNSHAGLILVYLGGVMAINIWLMKGFFDTVPRDLDESAMMDGASQWQAYWHIILPLVRPVLAVVGILTFIGVYNDFLLAQILLQDKDQFTLAVGLVTFARQQFGNKWGLFAAGALMGSVPIIVIYLFLQDFIVGGLTTGAVKG